MCPGCKADNCANFYGFQTLAPLLTSEMFGLVFANILSVVENATIHEMNGKTAQEKMVAEIKASFGDRELRMCGDCEYGPVVNENCYDLTTHQGDAVAGGHINNSCPRCGWFTGDINDWPIWNEKLAEETLVGGKERVEARKRERVEGERP